MGLVVKNVEHGMTLPGGQFVPFRASRDYDTSRTGEPKKWASKWKYEDKPRKRKKVVKRRKTTAKKATAKRATAKRKTVAIGRGGGGGLRAYSLAASRAKGGRRGVAMSRNPRPRTTKDVFVVQQNWGYGWEDVNVEDRRKDGMRSVREYRENQPGVPTRLITRRVKLEGAGGGSGVAMSRNPSWETHPYLVVVKPPSSITNALEGQFKTLAAAKKYAQGLRARGLTRGRVVEIYDLSPGRSKMVSSKQNPTRGPKAFYEVIVSNIGKVWEGSNGFEARKTYNQYVALSKAGRGRAGGEDVSLWKDNEPIKEHYGTATESNPIPANKWTQAKVMRTKTGDVKVMLPGRR
jgi:hypothetical protein